MPFQKNANHQKPVNIFYVWYSELCRRLNSNPAPVVKPAKTKCQTVLDFVADRLKVEEWNPVINALRHDTSLHVIAIKSRIGNCQFLHEVDTEEKLRQMKRRSGSLWTAFILKSLLKSLSVTVKNTQVLTCLELDGLPMFAQYLEPFMKALQKNKTLKTLSLNRCRIGDPGCQMVCAYVRFSPNIEILVLSGCGLTAQSGEYLAKLIKYQQINRYCESWHNSLRYSDPNTSGMKGLKRITLNDNPTFTDSGLSEILNELDDDLWIKALDMQKCGITEDIAGRIIEVVQYSQSLEVVDFRQNELLSISTLDRILQILRQKFSDREPEYQWCSTYHSIACESVVDTTVSNYTLRNQQVYKSKSTPLRQICSKMSVASKPLRRSKTVEHVARGAEDSGQKVQELNCQLKEEIAKRIETERLNTELQRKLSQMSSSIHVELKPKEENAKSKVQSMVHALEKTENGTLNLLEKICANGVNGVSKNGANGYHNGDKACAILQRLVSKDDLQEESSEVDSLLNYVEQEDKDLKYRNGLELSDSQISLFKFMENLKNFPRNPKYYVNDKHVKKK